MIQCVEDSFYYGLFGQIITDLRKRKNIQAEQYVVRNFSVRSHRNAKSFIVSKLYENKIKDRKWINLYNSYCDKVAYRNKESIGLLSDLKLFFQAKKIFKLITSKEKLVALKIDDIQVGDLIYDTYLRFKPAPTVDVKDFYLVIVIWQALRNIKIAKKYFDKNIPNILLQSYSTYIQHGITARVALTYGTNVYTFGNLQSMEKKLSLDDYTHETTTKEYKNNFQTLHNKESKLKEAEATLESRLGGTNDRATSYMKKSAYQISETDVPDVKDAVVIFLHDFFDSPHVYKTMIFPDFLEWIEFIINTLENSSTLYFIKPHPNQIAESVEVVEKLKIKYPKLKMISPKITNKQLVDAGMKLGLTVYGTVAHELAYMGIPVITCGDNPHSSYDFCFEAKSKEQYYNLLSDIDSCVFDDIDMVKNGAKSFYYMYNLNSSDDQVLLETLSLFRDTCEILDVETNYDETIYTVYLEQLNKIKKNKEYKEFIEKL